MARYALLILPSANRVYSGASVALMCAELELFSRAVLDDRLGDIGETTIGGLPYVTFACEDLAERDAAFLAALSSVYALFQCDGAVLRPVALPALDRFDDDLVSIQRYRGKTNEQFTKLLLNVTTLSSAFARGLLDRRLAVIDPLCGRGTTLNQALQYGYDAAGVDIDGKDFDAYRLFMQTWLRHKRIKHRAAVVPVRRDGRPLGRRLDVTLAATKEGFKTGETQRLTVVHADTTQALEFFRPAGFDLLVTDAPYGVAHGSRTKREGLARSPLELLRAAAPVWAALLRSGGALGIAWNTKVARRDVAATALTDAGLQVLSTPPYRSFQHRVDQAIVRDLLIAHKP